MSPLNQLAGYEILGPLGEGVMGEVYKARDPQTEQLVVIKILPYDLPSERAVERFKREIRAALQLDHANLIAAYTAGQDDSGSWYYVMEFIDGTTVKQELLKGLMPERQALEIVSKVGQALEYAWSFKLVHRDIKPENIMLTRDGGVKLCDMGLAKSLDSETEVTMSGTVLGTPHYMSPEQARGEALDFRSDMYALGATLYQMVTTFPPFEGADPLTVINDLLSKEPASPRDHNPQLSDGACCIISKMMARNASDRYGSYGELTADIGRALGDRKTMAEESGQFRLQSQTDARNHRYRFCHVPNDRDFMFGRIAIRNKLSDERQLLEILDLQEEAAHHGALVALSDLMLTGAVLTPKEVASISRARSQYEIERSRELFLKAALDNDYVTAEQLEACREQQGQTGGELVPILIERGHVNAKQRKVIRCYQRMVRRKEEDQQFVQVAIENEFITQRQAQKCLVIQSNGIVMGSYRDLGGIMVSRGLMKRSHKQVILRAIRRSALTGTAVAELILEQRVSQEDRDHLGLVDDSGIREL